MPSGDMLWTSDHSQEAHGTPVAAVKDTIMTGYFAPLTSSGLLFVDGVIASCYVGHGQWPYWICHWSTLPLRVWPNFLSYVPLAGEIHPFAKWLMALSKLMSF